MTAASVPTDDQLARLAAAAAAAVPGVVRLQPGLRHLAGRAARTLFTRDGARDEEADRSGVAVDREPAPHVTVRVVVAADPPPQQTAARVRAAVDLALSSAAGSGLTVTVVIVDVET
ncbi:hypothetical protein [Nakamurella sp.]|uniref:hypothetical protein n=1 Tax=Nakamurella sp. TaxID=1869182 RepID=UPI003B3AD180